MLWLDCDCHLRWFPKIQRLGPSREINYEDSHGMPERVKPQQADPDPLPEPHQALNTEPSGCFQGARSSGQGLNLD